MRDYPPTKFAGALALICGAIGIVVGLAGYEIKDAGTTNLAIAWGVVVLCHSIEWHARQRSS